MDEPSPPLNEDPIDGSSSSIDEENVEYVTIFEDSDPASPLLPIPEKQIGDATTNKKQEDHTYDDNDDFVFTSSVRLVVHVATLALYLIPIFQASPHNKGLPVLDELHIVSDDNSDLYGPWPGWFEYLKRIFANDYWGRPMDSPSSHKSWRPLTVLSFRLFQNAAFWMSDAKQRVLYGHRIFNVLTHAAAADVVGILALRFWQLSTQEDGSSAAPTNKSSRCRALFLQMAAKIIFCLHPTHVEVVANAANRPHLLAVLCAAVMADPHISIYLFWLALIVGLLAAETFIFSVPPAVLTLSLIVYRQYYHHFRDATIAPPFSRQCVTLWKCTAVRWITAAAACILYLTLRYSMDWLSIPDGLIRPAENPFFHMTGAVKRMRNYGHVTALHVAKSMDIDVLGFSHEYGTDCVSAINNDIPVWEDARLYMPLLLAMLVFLGAVYLLYSILWTAWNRRTTVRLSTAMCAFLLQMAWLTTLLPITGIFKVGTFIADRIVVASTVSYSILVAGAVTQWCYGSSSNSPARSDTTPLYKLIVLLAWFVWSWRRIHFRTLDWMDSYTLLASSLQTCPRAAKSHLEISKIYSGLVPEQFNLTKSRYHLRAVEAIDPNFCDVHQQFAHVAIQEQQHLEFEQRLVQALQCPFTMGGSMELWKRYWDTVLLQPWQRLQQSGDHVNLVHKTQLMELQVRYNDYMNILRKAMDDEQQREEELQKSKQNKKSALPFVWDREL